MYWGRWSNQLTESGRSDTLAWSESHATPPRATDAVALLRGAAQLLPACSALRDQVALTTLKIRPRATGHRAARVGELNCP